MTKRESRFYEMLVRVDEFGVAHVGLFPAPSPGGQLFATINVGVSHLRTHEVTQATGGRDARLGASAKIAARNTLRSALRLVRDTARTVAAGTPGLPDKFRLPRSGGDQPLLAAAKAIVEAATPLRDQFVAHRLPATFLDDLTASVAAFQQSVDDHARATEMQVGARANIRTALAEALVAVRHLAPIVANVLKDDPGLMAEWQTARHVSSLMVPYPKRKPATPPAGPSPKAA